MPRLHIRYTKEGRVRFVSARDLATVWERALRRAEVPVAYSEGYTPHARVSFPDALPVGYASTGEYAELTLAAPIGPHDLERLSATLPEGMDVTASAAVGAVAPRLAQMLAATVWELVWPAAEEPPPAEAARQLDILRRRTEDVMARDRIPVERVRPDGATKTIDVRPAVTAMAVSTRSDAERNHPILRAVFRNDGPTVRPTDLHAALSLTAATPLPMPRLYRRVAQGRAVPGGLAEALTGELVGLVADGAAEAA